MINIYFVRHGETGGNVAKRHQQENSHLTKRGQEQARAAAKAVVKIKPTHLFVSKRIRALETGQYLAGATGLTPEVSELFVEICRPANMYGHRHRSVETVGYLWQWWRGQVGGTDCGVDGESYRAFLDRLKLAKQFLETLPDESTVVIVSHCVFICMFLAHMNNPAPLSLGKAVKTFARIKALPNGSFTHLQYNSQTEPRWRHLND